MNKKKIVRPQFNAQIFHEVWNREITDHLDKDVAAVGWDMACEYFGLAGAPRKAPPLPAEQSANQRQVGGDHYKTGGEEHWDRVHRLELDYFQAAITKYVERWKKKNGLEDLQKAAHYLQKYIELQDVKGSH